MGQSDIIKALEVERKCGNDAFLSPSDIEKALKNMGTIINKTNIYKGIIKIRCLDNIETRFNKENKYVYRVKEIY